MYKKLTSKIVLKVTAAYNDGAFLLNEAKTHAKILTQEIPETKVFREVMIRLVVPAAVAEELYEGLNSGKVELLVQEMKTKVERH